MLTDNQKEREAYISKLEDYVFYLLLNYREERPLLIDSIEPDLLKETIFKKEIEYTKDGKCIIKYVLRKGYNNLYKKVDFSNVSFDDVAVNGVDFSGWHNVTLNPQKVYQRDMSYTKLKGVKVIGSLHNCRILGIDTTGSSGVVVCTHGVYQGIMNYATLTDAVVIGDFEGIYTEGMDLTGAIMKESADIINFEQKKKRLIKRKNTNKR